MKKFYSLNRVPTWVMTMLLGVLVAGCGGGRDTVLGSGTSAAAPTVTATVPIAKTPIVTGVAINSAVTATFSKAMDATTLNSPATNFTVACPAGTAITGTVTYVAASRTATFTHPANFPANTTCTATISTGAKDSTGLALAAPFVWQFTTAATPDTTPPTVILTVPANLATNVPTNTLVTATFSEDMNPTAITGTSFTLVNTTLGTPVAGNVSYSVAGRMATFTPTTPATLPNGNSFTATVTTAVTDLAGNAMVANKVWTFSTGAALDTTPPTVTLVNPLDLATGVCINKTVNATFSEAMDATTITTFTYTLAPTASPGAPVGALVTYDAVTNIASLNPTADLAPSTPYTATIIGGASGVKDLAGNALVVNKVWSFTTGTSSCAVAPPLGVVAPFGSLGGASGATNTGTKTVITGDMSSTATAPSSITGFHDSATPANDIYTQTAANIGLVTGRIYSCTNSTTGPNSVPPGSVPNCTIATNALAAAVTAYNSLVAVSGGIDPSGPGGELGGLTLGPGVYKRATSFMVGSGDLTLDGQGDANAVWIFQMGSTLTIGDTVTPRNVILKPGSGAQAKNVYWQVGSSATLNGIVGGGTIPGTIIAAVKITVSTVSPGDVLPVVTLNGRAIGLTAQSDLNNVVINVPAP